jgi:hypothetical protein
MPGGGRPHSSRLPPGRAPAPMTAARKRWPSEVRAASVARFEAGVKARVIADELGTYATLVRMWAYQKRKRAAAARPALKIAHCLYCCGALLNGSAVCSDQCRNGWRAVMPAWRGGIYISARATAMADLAGDQRHDHPRPDGRRQRLRQAPPVAVIPDQPRRVRHAPPSDGNGGSASEHLDMERAPPESDAPWFGGGGFSLRRPARTRCLPMAPAASPPNCSISSMAASAHASRSSYAPGNWLSDTSEPVSNKEYQDPASQLEGAGRPRALGGCESSAARRNGRLGSAMS